MAIAWFRKKQTPSKGPRTPSRGAPDVAHEVPALPELPEATGGVGHLDAPLDPSEPLTDAELAIAERVAARLGNEDLDLPHLPATHLRLMDLVGNPECDVAELSRVISEDVVLTATLLRTANSVMFGGTREIDSVRGAVARIGLRGLRSTLYMRSLKSVMYRPPGLAGHSDEIWRQSCATAIFSRTLASFTGRDAERSFVLGLLHDVGRIPILRVLAEEASGATPRHALVREVLRAGHESVGARLADLWNLPDELAAVCGAHHEGTPLTGAPQHANTDVADESGVPAGPERDLTAFGEAVGLVRLADRIDQALHASSDEQIAAILADTASAEAAGLRADRLVAAVGACIRAWGSWRAQAVAA